MIRAPRVPSQLNCEWGPCADAIAAPARSPHEPPLRIFAIGVLVPAGLELLELGLAFLHGLGLEARRGVCARRPARLGSRLGRCDWEDHFRMTIDIKDHIRSIPDFPKPGILFYDISTLLAHPDAWQVCMGRLAKLVSSHQPDLLAGIESRGFLVAAPLALKLGCGFVMVRKRGKLPGATIAHEYALEYGADSVEIQADAVAPGQRIAVLDDLLATGGTMAATIALCRRVGAEVVAPRASSSSRS